MKIVLIANTSDTVDTGLVKLFKPNHSNRQFTRRFFFEKSGDEKKVFTPKIDKYLLINFNSVKLSDSYDEDNWDIVIISDQVSPDSYDRRIFDLNTLVIYHKKPQNITEYLNTLTTKGIKRGYHDTDDSGYSILIDVINAFNEETNKFDASKYQEVLKKFVKWFNADDLLEEKLSLLDKCMSPEELPAEIPSTLKDDKMTADAYEQFRTVIDENGTPKNEDALSDVYLKTLNDLRDNILSDY